VLPLSSRTTADRPAPPHPIKRCNSPYLMQERKCIRDIYFLQGRKCVAMPFGISVEVWGGSARESGFRTRCSITLQHGDDIGLQVWD
jgi:hypothetical protein